LGCICLCHQVPQLSNTLKLQCSNEGPTQLKSQVAPLPHQLLRSSFSDQHPRHHKEDDISFTNLRKNSDAHIEYFRTLKSFVIPSSISTYTFAVHCCWQIKQRNFHHIRYHSVHVFPVRDLTIIISMLIFLPSPARGVSVISCFQEILFFYCVFLR